MTFTRITKREDFVTIGKKGKRKHTSHFIVITSPNEVQRFGITVTKRTASKAVDRNRIKRVLREVFRLRPHFFPSGNVIVIAKRGAEKLSFWDVENEFLSCG